MKAPCLKTPALAAAAILALLLGACAVGPKYQRPEMQPPPAHRGVEGQPAAESLADLPWWEVFKDPELQSLIREATVSNLDLQVAASRVVEARAIAGVAKSFLFPEVNLGAGYTTGELSTNTDPPAASAGDRNFHNWNVGLNLSWEIDLFGRLRREKESAFARFLASEQGRRGVLITLIGDVSSSYFFLRQLDLQLEIANETLRLNDERVAFYQKRLKGGVSNRLELDQAVANRALTASSIPDIERQIALTENGLSVLLGRPPGPIPRGATLQEQPYPPAIPSGLPSALLERRPDVLEAEELLVAANADVGAAKALFFPTISLTGAFGVTSRALGDLAKRDSTIWNLAAGLFQPIFQAGRIKRNYEAAKARFDQALAEYRKAALNSYREVADSLVTIEKLAVSRTEQEKGVEALQDAAKLARSRYDNGLSNYLEVLIADQQLFQQQLALAQTEGSQFQALTQLYRSLGGGWVPEEAAPEGGTPAAAAPAAAPAAPPSAPPTP
jgi:outer membrane protein, multidrug efflux system